MAFPTGTPALDLTDLYAFPKPGDAGKSILIMNVHPSVGVNPAGPTIDDPFAPEAIYELKIDTDGDLVAKIAYRVRFLALQGRRADCDSAPCPKARRLPEQATTGRLLSKEHQSRRSGIRG